MTAGWILIGYQCFYCSSAGKNHSENDFHDIVSLCIYRCGVVWTLLFFNIDNDFLNYIFIIIFIVLILGVNKPLDFLILSLPGVHSYERGQSPGGHNPRRRAAACASALQDLFNR